MNKNFIVIAFALVVLAQLAVPSQLIIERENILKNGKLYKFITRPVDPNDPFRGKYITLDYKMSKAYSNDSEWKRKDEIYIYLKDSLGYATVYKVSKTPLDIEDDFIKGKVSWYNFTNKQVQFNLPFDRFYMNEYKAKPAELAYTKMNRRGRANQLHNVYGLVAVKNGQAVLKNVFINELPIADYVEQVQLESKN